jgi:hypothetical protein
MLELSRKRVEDYPKFQIPEQNMRRPVLGGSGGIFHKGSPVLGGSIFTKPLLSMKK